MLGHTTDRGRHISPAGDHATTSRGRSKSGADDGGDALPPLFLTALLVVLAVYIPPARFILAVWVVWYVIIGVVVVRTLRRRRHGVLQTPTLWLTADNLGFTSSRGVTVSCPRTVVTSALRVFATVSGGTRDLLVFRDAEDNAVLSAPLGVWRPEDIDRVTDALGIQPAHRTFVD